MEKIIMDENHEARIKQLEEDNKINKEKIDKLTTNDAVTQERYQTILNTVNNMMIKVEEIKSTPGMYWKVLITALISGGASIFISYLIK